jgi:DNA-binding NarL/FixJ family response regulator
MPTRRPAETTPDLFSELPTVTAAGPLAVPKGKAGPDSLAPRQRNFLPKDLAGTLKRLDDVEIDALLAAVTAEAERRGRRSPSPAKEKPVAAAKPQRRQEAAADGACSLTTGKQNAVRAAFKAGVRPSAIARQFGISQSDVRKALAQDRPR